MNNKKDWYQIKSYPHIGLKLTHYEKSKIEAYISNPDKIKTHSFLPFIHKQLKTRKFRKEYSNEGKLSNNGLRKESFKIRNIYYASHIDSNIFSYYSSILSSLYEDKLLKNNLGKTITGYRRIQISSSPNSRNMCNVDFANEVFQFIKNNSSQELTAIAFDIKSYFDNLDHKLIKKSWCNILDVNALPDDHYNVYSNLTKFSYINESNLFNEFKDEIITKTKSGIVKHKRIDKLKYLKNQGAIAFCNKKDFKERISKKGYIKSNKYVDKSKQELRIKGIPQGSPISSVLANIYLFNFDLLLKNYLDSLGGLYRRYSDDMVVICNTNDKENVIKFLKQEIEKFKLEIQDSKTQIFHFIKDNDNLYKCYNENFNGVLTQNRNFEYLGFNFDGQFTLLKSSSLSKFYRTLKRTLKMSFFFANYTKCEASKGQIFKRRLYRRFSYLGATRRRIYKRDKDSKWIETHKYDWGNFLTYAYLASKNIKDNKIRSQIKRHWKIFNDLIKIEEKKLLINKKGIKMRKLKLQVQMSVDGYIAGPNGEMDWMVWDWDQDLKKYVEGITESVDCIVLGRKLAQGFIPHWASHPEEEGAEKINSLKKVVFTKTLDKSEWDNTTLAKGDIVEEINKLKNQDGKDLIAYGGANFVSSLIKYGLIDEMHLLINPTAIGKGMPIFQELQNTQNLTLVTSKSFECGIVVLCYKPKQV